MNYPVLFISLLHVSVAFSQTDKETLVEFIENGNYQKAVTILETDASSWISPKDKGDLYTAMEYFQKAAFHYEMALQSDNNNGIALRLGKTYERLRQYKKAQTIYRSALEKDPENSVIKFRLSKILLRFKRVNAALKNLKELAEKDQKNPNYPHYIGMGHRLKKNPAAAIDYFLKAYKKDSTHLKNIIQLATVFYQLKQQDSVKLFTSKGLLIDSQNKNLNQLKINQHRRDKEYQLAIDLLLEQEKIHENEFYNAKMLGICYFNLDSLTAAKSWFIVAEKRNENDFKIWTYLGDINVKNKNYKKAIVNYSMATHTGMVSRDAEYLKLGLVFNVIGNQAKAIEMFNQAIHVNWQNEKAHFERALAAETYYKDKKIAYGYYQKFLQNFYFILDTEKLEYVRSRIKKIKETYFLKGIELN